MPKPEPLAEFAAVIPNLQIALTISGKGDGRLKLDIPESELPAFAREKCLRVVIYEQTP